MFRKTNILTETKDKTNKNLKQEDMRVEFCKCGVIHFLDRRDIDKAVVKNKEYIFICDHCGVAKIIGADIDYFDGTRGYSMYTDVLTPGRELNKRMRRKKIYKILYSQGKEVFMETGYRARSFHGNEFQDVLYPDFMSSMKINANALEWQQKYEEWVAGSKRINMHSLAHNLTKGEMNYIKESYPYMTQFKWEELEEKSDAR